MKVENNASLRHQLADKIKVSVCDFYSAQDHQLKISMLLNKKITNIGVVGAVDCFYAHGLKRIGVFSPVHEVAFGDERHSKAEFTQYSDNIDGIN